MLCLMASDFGFHALEPFLLFPEAAAGAALLRNEGHREPLDGCGIPGHENTPFHHHHLLTLVEQNPLPAPLIAQGKAAGMAAVPAVASPDVTPFGRAPPRS
ncbi:MAG TPA: hypothetical protein VNN17_07520 [Terriglobia bacterium]|nr:hypothetical protein [Terriglobia bacterium]